MNRWHFGCFCGTRIDFEAVDERAAHAFLVRHGFHRDPRPSFAGFWVCSENCTTTDELLRLRAARRRRLNMKPAPGVN